MLNINNDYVDFISGKNQMVFGRFLPITEGEYFDRVEKIKNILKGNVEIDEYYIKVYLDKKLEEVEEVDAVIMVRLINLPHKGEKIIRLFTNDGEFVDVYYPNWMLEEAIGVIRENIG